MLCPNSNERLITLSENDLKGCYPYLDDITIAGANQVGHDRNLQALMSLLRWPISLFMNLKLNFPSLKSHSWCIRLVPVGATRSGPGTTSTELAVP